MFIINEQIGVEWRIIFCNNIIQYETRDLAKAALEFYLRRISRPVTCYRVLDLNTLNWSLIGA